MTKASAAPKPYSIAVVSGKGGVGKTMLTANIAWVCGQVTKTLLVDLDFQNQGSTGLFEPHFKFQRSNAFFNISTGADVSLNDLTKVGAHIYFLPAVDRRQRPSTEKILTEVYSQPFETKIGNFIANDLGQIGIGVVILDCHGGLDPVSFAAFQSADVTLMVTEADNVTFTGTLELLKYYEEQRNLRASSLRNETSLKSNKSSPTDKNCHQENTVKFIVNRLPSKFNYGDLHTLYNPQFADEFGALSKDQTIFSFIPADELLSAGFGEYPFHIPLAHKSIFSLKVKLICYELLNEEFDFIKSATLNMRRFIKEKTRRKIQRTVISREQKNISSIMNFFAWSSIVAILYMGSLAFVGIMDSGDLFKLFRENKLFRIYFASAVIISIMPVIWYFFKAMVGIVLHFGRRHSYQKGLFKALGTPLTVLQTISISRSFVFRWATAIGVFVFGLVFLIFVALVVVPTVNLVFD